MTVEYRDIPGFPGYPVGETDRCGLAENEWRIRPEESSLH